MTMTISKDKNSENKFSFEVHNGFDLVEFGGNYPTYKEAESAGQFAYRALHMNNFKHSEGPIRNDYMTFDDILAELDAD